MDKLHEFDPAGGYVAVPAGLLDYDLAPGPFRLMIELCRMANRDGECWPSLGQLSEKIGRSRAALSGYLNDLRDAGLVDTIQQKMANGYNYRLKFVITFWADWRAAISKPRLVTSKGQNSERRVQPVERRVNSKNQNQENHSCVRFSFQENGADLTNLVSAWKTLAHGAPFPSFNADPPATLIAKSQSYVKSAHHVPLDYETCEAGIEHLWRGLNVPISKDAIAAQVTELVKRQYSQENLSLLAETIAQSWQGHWKRPPSPAQFEEFLKSTMAKNPNSALIKALQQYLRRAEFAQNRLQRCAPSGTVQPMQAA